MNDQSIPTPNPELINNEQLSEQERKFGKSIYKKWIYAKFDAKLILEIVQKDIYFNPKLAILLPTINPDGKKKFLSATLDLKSLQNLQNELGIAIKILEEKAKEKEKEKIDL